MKRHYKPSVTRKLIAFLEQCEREGRHEFTPGAIPAVRRDTVTRRRTDSYALRPLRYEAMGTFQRSWWSVPEALKALRAHEAAEGPCTSSS